METHKWLRWEYLFYGVSACLLLIDVILYGLNSAYDLEYFNLSRSFALLGISLGFLSLGVAFRSARTSDMSDKKMQDIAVYLLHEKLAAMNGYLPASVSNFLQHEHGERIKHDLGAALLMGRRTRDAELYHEVQNMGEKFKGKAAEAISTYKGSRDIGVLEQFIGELDQMLHVQDTWFVDK